MLETIRQGKIGGGESHVLDLVATLDKQVFEPVVLSFTDGPMMEALQRMQVPAFVISSEKAFDLGVWRKVKHFIREQKIDVVHVHGTRANTNVLWAARSLGLPVVYTIHGWSFHEGLNPLAKRLRIAAEQFITRKTQMNICVSESNRQTGLQSFSTFNSIVIRNGINLNRFNPDAACPDIKTALGIPAGRTVVGYIARMTLQKDPVTMVKAFAAALKREPSLYLLMVGDGELKQAAMDMAASLGITADVRFEGFRQDVPAVLQAMDIYCLPSLWEGFPIGVLEAMAMRKAVIATDVDGTKEAVTHGVDGWLVPAEDPERLTDAIVTLATDTQLRSTLQHNAGKTINEKFNVAGMTAQIAAVYQQLYKA
ncbi:Glycosyltransferase involved in cell wall bisynthesis [Chitinophaga sp. 180180018-2]|nr:Glycosyltransferase involved in cell wall biosynthesis [Chitinophaga sp. 212800010-3]